MVDTGASRAPTHKRINVFVCVRIARQVDSIALQQSLENIGTAYTNTGGFGLVWGDDPGSFICCGTHKTTCPWIIKFKAA